jgi:hypothetical protein
VQAALKSLPWVDQGKDIDANTKTHRVRFTVKDKSKFNLDEIKQVFAAKAKRFADVKLISGPG